MAFPLRFWSTGDYDNSVKDDGSYWQIDSAEEGGGKVLSVVLEKGIRLTPWVRPETLTDGLRGA